MEKMWFDILKIICFSLAVYLVFYILFSWYFTDFIKDSKWIFLFVLLCLDLLTLIWRLIKIIEIIEETYYDHFLPWVNSCAELFEAIMHEFFLFLELFYIYLDYFIVSVFEFSASYPMETFLLIVLVITSTWLFMLLVTFLEHQYYKYKNKERGRM